MLSFFLRACAATVGLAVPLLAAAAPTVTGPAGSVPVGSTVTFTVSDLAPADGFDPDPLAQLYMVDIHLGYDTSVLQYLSAAPSPNIDVLATSVLPPSGTDPDPGGSLYAQVVAFSTPNPGADLFTVSFRALQSAIGSRVTVGPFSDGTGVYGGNVGVNAFPTFTSDPVTISAVPEPANVALMLAGLSVLGLARRYSR